MRGTGAGRIRPPRRVSSCHYFLRAPFIFCPALIDAFYSTRLPPRRARPQPRPMVSSTTGRSSSLRFKIFT